MTDIIVSTSTEQIIDFMEQGRQGLAACSNIPVRNFRLLVAIKLPGESPGVPNPEEFIDREKVKPLQDIKRQITETLKAALLSPRAMQPECSARMGTAVTEPLSYRVSGAQLRQL